MNSISTPGGYTPYISMPMQNFEQPLTSHNGRDTQNPSIECSSASYTLRDDGYVDFEASANIKLMMWGVLREEWIELRKTLPLTWAEFESQYHVTERVLPPHYR